MIAIIDYGVGNLYSLSHSLAYLGLECQVTRDPRRIQAASRLILPGVGAFGDAMAKHPAEGRGGHAPAGHLPGHAAAV